MIHEIRDATSQDAIRLGQIIGEAFADDPVSCWTLGSPARILHTFSTLTREVYLTRGRCMIADSGAGTLWLEPGGDKRLALWPTITLGLKLATGEHPRHVIRALQVDTVMQRKRPREPHMYLFAVGVTAHARGRGLGRRIIEAMLDECDARGLPAFLENTNPRNHSLYASLGFESVETYSPVAGCPAITSMWRSAYTGGA